MTLPASGPISFQDLRNETGRPAGYSDSLQWVKSNAKTAKGGPVNVINDMNRMHGLAYYKDNTLGNCSNGNCAQTHGNCGNINCRNCVITGGVNCANCDATPFLQPNCNCNCTYNCSVSQTSYNCNCDCWLCACTW